MFRNDNYNILDKKRYLGDIKVSKFQMFLILSHVDNDIIVTFEVKNNFINILF